MRKGLIFYVLCGFCALSSIGALSSCASTNSKEEEFMADYTDLETFRNDVINGTDVVGKTLKLANDNIGYYYNGLESWRIIWKDIQLDSSNTTTADADEPVIQIKITYVRKTIVADNPIQYYIEYRFYQMH